ncbi:MAG TPA: bacillithiol system redox-active protein YtxJ [Bacteroidia bacterium]|nr:bacillithiol system redox-active protein YtxJ [Bacteroidia bacterium]HRG53781.1 bacillithiol system redox-active protein YtxJ [Bacteroidia bacterium]
MNWLSLTTEEQLEEIDKRSFASDIQGVLLFKHSTRCSISSMALNRLDRNLKQSGSLPVYLLDLLDYRSVSQQIALRYEIEHESPQILIIKNGKCIYHASHSEITASAIEAVIFNN